MNLPAPVHSSASKATGGVRSAGSSSGPASVQSRSSPPYGYRTNYVPKELADYGDGGAFPEINRMQYPLNMGKVGAKGRSVERVQLDHKGNVMYDSIVKTGKSDGTGVRVQSALVDTKESDANAETLALPDEEEIADTAERTRLALEAKMSGKVGGAGKSHSHHEQIQSKNDKDPQYIRYNVNPDAPGFSKKTAQRVIKMVQAPVDPMEPPKHKIEKHFVAKDRSKSPPAPVLHAPAKKLSKAEKQAWKIPPALSNWKNERGYIVPLDKRVALDGRGGVETTINDKFASLSEALYLSERKAAEDLRARNNVRKQMALKEKEDKEEELRELAAMARASRVESLSHGTEGYSAGVVGSNGAHSSAVNNPRARGVNNAPAWMTDQQKQQAWESKGGGDGGDENEEGHEDDDTPPMSRSSTPDFTAAAAAAPTTVDTAGDGVEGVGEEEEDSAQLARVQREKRRAERRRDMERELRQENMKGGGRKGKRGDESRDISEKIALGMHTGDAGGGGGAEAMYDARLFNQSSGMDAGFGGDDEYNAYSKPLFNKDGAASSVYRPRQAAEDAYGDADSQLKELKSSTSKFRPERGFQGSAGGTAGEDETTAGGGGSTSGPRSAPVQFEMARGTVGGGGDGDGNDGGGGGDGGGESSAKKRARRA